MSVFYVKYMKYKSKYLSLHNKEGGAINKQHNLIVNEKNILKYIEKNTKSSLQATYDNNNKLEKNISNYGLQKGEIATREGGEYNGFSIKALEEIKPVLTDDRIMRAIKYLSGEDIQKAIGVLRLVDEVYEYGLGIVYSVLKLWLENNNIPVPDEYIKKAIPIKSKTLLDWIYAFNWAPINGRFEIVDIGSGKNYQYSVVPESWMGRIFNNADQLHAEMDKLDWRKGKPPVNFCAIYAMNIKESQLWNKVDELKNLKFNVKIGISISINRLNKNDNKINTQIKIFKSKKEYTDWINNYSENLSCLLLDLNTEDLTQKLVIICNPDDILETNPIYNKKRSVGLLVSTMQKLIRRGPTCSQALYDVLKELWKSPFYNLPEQQFLKVNACRQLAWRLLISSIEDVQAFEIDKNDNNRLSMEDLAGLSILANGYSDLQFNEIIFEKLLLTALSVQRINNKWDLLKNSDYLQDKIPLKDTNNNLLNSFVALSYYMPAREWDDILIKFSYNYILQKKFVSKLENLDLELYLEDSIQKDCDDGLLAGMDMHPYPNLLILFQGSLPFLPYDIDAHTTKKLWNFIWDNSSGVNFRIKSNDNNKLDNISNNMLTILKSIQYSLLYPENNGKIIKNKYKIDKIKLSNKTIKNNDIKELTKRTAFILLFGERRTYVYKNKSYHIIISGCDPKDNEYCKVKQTNKEESKYIEGNLRYEIERAFFKNFSDIIESPQPPAGYKWIWNDKRKIQIKTEINNDKIIFSVDEIIIDPYDASNILVPLDRVIPLNAPDYIKDIIEQVVYLNNNTSYNDYHINLLMRNLHELNYPLFDWYKIVTRSNLPSSLWKSVYIKLYNNINNEIQIGPVDGHGNSLRDSINYLYEGTIWRIFNMLSFIYPKAITITRAAKSLKFGINQNTAEYIDLLNKLYKLSFVSANINSKNISKNRNISKIKITTKLWDHQQKTVDKILKDVSFLRRRGFGDASDVGAGKTLTALAVMAGLYKMNIEKKLENHKGFLVLLPTTHLYNTWKDEIIKHCNGFHMIFQNADGSLIDNLNTELVEEDIQPNTILITTLGRMRDHPLFNSWIFVMIDECLSVQNKSALQTEEAWRQIITSQYGVMLASATFFRTRFDKLFYMIKMLNSGLPENKEYLDAILAESIVSNVPIKIREWKISYNAFNLSDKMRKEYDILLDKDMNSERLYMKLQSYLFDNFDYVDVFQRVIIKCEKTNRRCLIYARSKEEADLFAERIEGATRFPDVSGTHLAISYTEGTYGLNHLIYLDTIVTRFPEPDKLPQMKGRLDRPNQEKDILHIEYIYVKNTIDQGGLLRLELANRFYNNYILPMADYYDIALGRKEIKKGSVQIN